MTNTAAMDVHAFLSHLGVEGEEDDSLEHYGVKGMKWGVRRDLQKLTSDSDRVAYVNKVDSKWLTKVNKNQGKKVHRVLTRSSRRIKKEVTKPLNQEYKKKDLKKSSSLRAELNEKIRVRTEQIIREETHRQFGISPSRLQRVILDTSLLDSHGAIRVRVAEVETNAKLNKQFLKIYKSDQRRARQEARASAKGEVKHALEDEDLSEDEVLEMLEGLSFIITFDEDGLPDEVLNSLDFIEHDDSDDAFLVHYDTEACLEHYGVKGMQWGVRRSQAQLDAASARVKTKNTEGVVGVVDLEGRARDGYNGVMTFGGGARKPGDIPSEEQRALAKATDKLAHKLIEEKGLFDPGGALEGVVKKYEKQLGLGRDDPWPESAVEPFARDVSRVFDNLAAKYQPKGYVARVAMQLPKNLEDDWAIYLTVGDASSVTSFRDNRLPEFIKNRGGGSIVKHSADDPITAVAKIVLKRDPMSNGFISAEMGSLEELSHSDISDEDDSLEHYGVKGMQWGVRKDHFAAGEIDLDAWNVKLSPVSRAGEGMSRKEIREVNKLSKEAKRIFDDYESEDSYRSLMNAGVASMSKKDASDPTKYDALSAETLSIILSSSLDETRFRGISVKVAPAGNDKFIVLAGSNETVNAAAVDLGMEDLFHVEDVPLELVVIQIDRETHGYKAGYVSLSYDDLSHSDISDLYDALEHHGIKGMKWGVRRPDGPDGTVSSRVSSKSSSKKSTSSAGGSSNKKSSSDRLRGLKRKKVKEIAATPEVKSATTSVAKLAVNSAVPALMAATGVAAPLALGVSLTVRVLLTTEVQEALAPAKGYVKSVVKFSGDVTVSQMPKKTNPVMAAAKKRK